jgi:hypothetical protein
LNQVIVDEEAFSFVRYYAVVHADASEASRILVGGEVTAGAFGGLLTDNTGSRTMRPGEGFVEFSRRADAMEVVGEGGTEPARSSILVMNPDGANDATYSIWIFGQKKGS